MCDMLALVTVHNITVDFIQSSMGGRKLHFDNRKNQERKRQQKRPLNLTVSIPLQLLPMRECVVSIPIPFILLQSSLTVLFFILV